MAHRHVSISAPLCFLCPPPTSARALSPRPVILCVDWVGWSLLPIMPNQGPWVLRHFDQDQMRSVESGVGPLSGTGKVLGCHSAHWDAGPPIPDPGSALLRLGPVFTSGWYMWRHHQDMWLKIHKAVISIYTCVCVCL